eukprot:TRINITY_DN107835_c0_g1_i1.p1 TRINITY_DN107835_c0_g1~~TRINITY_DN107835_c0_g1_i1.p1  ORF type:complete len:861 (-),score=183.12 TRINITY_DN107835_c0_g1_i1:16-2598(-)
MSMRPQAPRVPTEAARLQAGPPGSAPAVPARPNTSRLISEEDLHAERERWRQTCMHEVWNLENAAFERINSQLEEATSRLTEDVTREVMKHIEEERQQRAASISELRAQLTAQSGSGESEAIASLRRDIQAVQKATSEVARSQLRQASSAGSEASDAAEAAVQALRSELEMRTAQHQASTGSLDARLEEYRLQASSLQAAVSDLRTELAVQRERQDLSAAAALTELRQEFGGVQFAQQQVLTDQAAKSSQEVRKELQALQSEVHQQVQELKANLASRQEEIELLQYSERELQRKVSVQERAAESSEEVARLVRRMDYAEQQLASSTAASNSNSVSADLIKDQLSSLQSNVERLTKDLTDERNDRCKSLSEVNRLVESVAKASSASIEETEARLSTKISAASSGAHTPLNVGQIFARPQLDHSTKSLDMSEEGRSPSVSQEIQAAMGSSFAKLVGEMDAELRVEMNSRLRLVSADLRSDIIKEVTIRCASTEARIGSVEAELKAKVSSIADDVLHRYEKLEAAQLPIRMQGLEQEVKRSSLLLAEVLGNSRAGSVSVPRAGPNGGSFVAERGSFVAEPSARRPTTADSSKGSLQANNGAAIAQLIGNAFTKALTSAGLDLGGASSSAISEASCESSDYAQRSTTTGSHISQELKSSLEETVGAITKTLLASTREAQSSELRSRSAGGGAHPSSPHASQEAQMQSQHAPHAGQQPAAQQQRAAPGPSGVRQSPAVGNRRLSPDGPLANCGAPKLGPQNPAPGGLRSPATAREDPRAVQGRGSSGIAGAGARPGAPAANRVLSATSPCGPSQSQPHIRMASQGSPTFPMQASNGRNLLAAAPAASMASRVRSSEGRPQQFQRL